MTERSKILIVDDDTEIATGLAEGLRLEGYRVETAGDGREAAERVRLRSFDLILMDAQMPVMNGVDSFFEIRQIRPAANVVLMSSSTCDTAGCRPFHREAV